VVGIAKVPCALFFRHACQQLLQRTLQVGNSARGDIENALVIQCRIAVRQHIAKGDDEIAIWDPRK
jgi:hypothetical protein